MINITARKLRLTQYNQHEKVDEKFILRKISIHIDLEVMSKIKHTY